MGQGMRRTEEISEEMYIKQKFIAGVIEMLTVLPKKQIIIQT